MDDSIYERIKSRVSDAVIFFKKGDCYELHNDDIKMAQDVAGLHPQFGVVRLNRSEMVDAFIEFLKNGIFCIVSNEIDNNNEQQFNTRTLWDCISD